MTARWALRLGAATLLATVPGCAPASPDRVEGQEKGAAMRLFDFVDAVMRLERLDHRSAGALFRQSFVLANSTGPFNIYRLDRLTIGDGLDALRIELREPVPGGGATAGALMFLDVSGPCVTRAMLEARYGRMQLFQAPRGRSADERTVWQIGGPDGAVRFGFAERDPACLAGVTFERRL